MESRFARGEGSILPGRMWLDSSRNDEVGFLEQHLKFLEVDPTGLVLSHAIWEVLGPAGKVKYSGKTFKVFIGDQNRDPCLISSPIGIPEHLIIDVPIEYETSFSRDIYGALRDLAGIATWSTHKFLPNSNKVKSSLILENAIYRDVIELDFDDKHEKLIDYVDIYKIDKNRKYYMHFDLGIKHDRTGIALTSVTGKAVIEKVNESGSYTVKENTYECNLIIPVIPKPGKEVPISKLKNLVFDLIERGIMVIHVSADGYQSTNLLQDVRSAGVMTELLSMDKTRNGYDYLKNAIMEDRISLPKNRILESELLDLVDMGKKIDHPEKGCFIGDTLVQTVSGFKSIKNIHSGDRVYSFDKAANCFEVVTVVDQKLTKFVTRLINLIFDDESYCCTPDHLILLDSGEYIAAEMLKPGFSVKSIEPLKLVDIKEVNLTIAMPVYDLEVSKNSNFLLSNGAVVHNSKDLTDALAGSLWACYNNNVEMDTLPPVSSYLELLEKSIVKEEDPLYSEILKQMKANKRQFKQYL
jgi:hypothetical protein